MPDSGLRSLNLRNVCYTSHMEKMCGRCKELKDASEFHKNKARPSGLADTCKKCKKQVDATHYVVSGGLTSNRSQSNRARRDRNRLIVRDHLNSNPCVDCGESDLVVLQFDHTDQDKAKDVSAFISGYSVTRLLQEIAKCDVVCANCHTRRTASRGGWWRMEGNDTLP